MEALIVVLILAWAVKKGVEQGSAHWQSSKAANRTSTRGRSVPKRAASAVQHDVGYWFHQVLNGFPQTRDGLAAGWHAGRTAQAQGAAARQKAKAEHLSLRARLIPEIQEHRRRQEEALEQIRAAREPEPEPEESSGYPRGSMEGALAYREQQPGGNGGRQQGSSPVAGTSPGRPAALPPEPPDPLTGKPDTGIPAQFTPAGPPGPQPQPSPSTTEGTTDMPTGTTSADTTYTQQLAELTAIRQDAEAEVNSVQRKRMVNRLDILMSLGLDSASLSEAAAIDDALQAQEKAAQQVLDAADAAIHGLKQRHGGIQEAVDSAPVDKPAQPEFYES